jgi:hypothetical protein
MNSLVVSSLLPLQSRIGLSPRNALLVITWIFLSLAAGYRWLGVGRDYFEYLYFFNELSTWQSAVDSRFEIGFSAIAWVMKTQLGASYGDFATLMVALALGIKLYLIAKHTQWPLLATFCYLPLFYVLHEYTQIRAGVAIAFGLLATFAFSDRRWLSSILWLCIGMLFQSSVAALVLGFAVYTIMKDWRLLIIACAAAVALSSAIASLDLIGIAVQFNPLVQSYIEGTSSFAPPNIFSPLNIFLFATIIVSWQRIIHTSVVTDKLIFVMCVLALATFGIFYSLPMFANRFFGLFSVFMIFLSFRSARLDIGALAGLFTIFNAFWATRNALGEGLIG